MPYPVSTSCEYFSGTNSSSKLGSINSQVSILLSAIPPTKTMPFSPTTDKDASKSSGRAAVVASIVPRAPLSNFMSATKVSSASNSFKRLVIVALTDSIGPNSQLIAST